MRVNFACLGQYLKHVSFGDKGNQVESTNAGEGGFNHQKKMRRQLPRIKMRRLEKFVSWVIGKDWMRRGKGWEIEMPEKLLRLNLDAGGCHDVTSETDNMWWRHCVESRGSKTLPSWFSMLSCWACCHHKSQAQILLTS